MLPFRDLYKMPEDERIKVIGEAARNKIVVFMVDDDGEKGDRYVRKLRERFPGIVVLSRSKGPVADVESIKVLWSKGGRA